MASIILFLFTILLILCIYIICHIFRHFSYFKQRNIPTPTLPSVFYGHAKVLWSSVSFSEKLREWTKVLGPIYGIFEGTQPIYVVSDPAFLQEVFITQFSNFHTKRDLRFLSAVLGANRRNVITSNGSHWKRQRQVLNPAFSSGKLRNLVPTMKEFIQLFMNKLDEKLENENSLEIDIYPRFKNLTMDIIGQTAFGIDFDTQNGGSNIFMTKVNQNFTQNFEQWSLARLNRLFPFLTSVWVVLYKLFCKVNPQYISASVWLSNNIFGLVRERVEFKETTKRADLLQLMIDASVTENQFHLTQPELLSNVFLILLAGSGTSSIVLSSCAFVLATHQDVQDKLYNEILDLSTEDEYVLSTTKMNYIDMFIKEVLRMYPIVTQLIRRECVQDTTVNGHKIAKGAVVQADVLSVHFDENLWGPLPVNEFHPERHETKRHPMSFLAFGAGPRGCIGARFALMEIKLCLIQLLTNYRIMPCSTKNTQLNRREYIGFIPTDVWIKLAKR